MTINLDNYSIYLRPGCTDMRKGSTQLAYLVQNEMKLHPFEKSIFLFCGRNKRTIKAIVWDGNGWIEIIKRLECGKSFCYPTTISDSMKVTFEQVKLMLRGANVWRNFPTFTPEFVG